MICRTLLLIAMVVAAGAGHAQIFHYVEPGAPKCPPLPAPTQAAPKAVARGVAVPGRIHVRCGLDQGSYTVSLSSTDRGATFSPRTFVVNFGRIVGKGTFAVTFSTVGIQSVSTTIMSNMGSPVVGGHFASQANQFNVVNP